MSRWRKCGQLPPAVQRTPYCPVCEAVQAVPTDEREQQRRHLIDEIFDRLERIAHLHRQYGRKRRR